ncbi:MAG: Rne/Rng family ribonuclease [Deltaproteobacteria bacterium]|nr:Rne/Rng family ribonuclease [Deltaproteobacteria bacterium]
MDKILINAVDPEECRVAMLDSKGGLVEYYTDSSLKQFGMNNIFKGYIHNIEPALQAVFVNFGTERNGFLQLADVHPEYFLADPPSHEKDPDIRKLLKKNQPILVQVIKEPSAIKGAALTTFISLAGRFVVLTPGRAHVGVSRKIFNEKERNRLREISESLPVPEGCGYIIRTVAEDRTKQELAEDLFQVFGLWEDIRRQSQTAAVPSLIYREHDLAIKILRDHYTSDCSEIIVDEPEVFRQVQDYVRSIAPGQESKVKLHSEKRPIFARHQLEQQLETVHQPSVRLKSGGSIVISPTEALVAIDVNSGKGTREGSLEETAYMTNLEAADEVARQLRLRDLGGVVVIDFIDMREEKHRREIERRFREAAKTDKAKMDFGNISKFGLLEITRQRLRPPIEAGISTVCPHCKGRGMVYTPESASLAFLRQAAQLLSMKGSQGILKAKLNRDVADFLLNNKRAELLNLEERHKTRVLITGDPAYAPSNFEITQEKRPKELETLKPGQVAKWGEDGEEDPGGKFHKVPSPHPDYQGRPANGRKPEGRKARGGRRSRSSRAGAAAPPAARASGE